MAGDVGGVGGDLVGDQALAHVFGVGQAQVFLGGHLAKHGRTVPARQGGTDGAGDVVITRSDVADQGTERIEKCFAALLHLLFDVELNLIHWHVARTLHHHLHIVFPGPAGELTKGFSARPAGPHRRRRAGSRVAANRLLLVPKSASAATDLDLISYLRSIPDARMRRGVRFPAWYLLLVAVLGILSGCQSLRDLERYSFGEGFAYAIRHHSVLTVALGIELARQPSDSSFRHFFHQLS